MKILVLTTSTNNTESFVGSLFAAGHDPANISVLTYDRKWHGAALEAIQANPSFQAQLQQGTGHIRRDACAMDDEILHAVKLGKPDVVVYISAWQGDFIPLNETLGEVNAMAPLVHFLSDGQDPPWWPQLKEFERRQCFSLTVNIDGGHDWPGGHVANWRGKVENPWEVTNALTLLTPVDTRHFPPSPVAYHERPYAVGYAGNQGGHFRSELVRSLNRVVGFAFRERDHQPGSYPHFADFLRHVRVSVSTPFTGSGQARQVKGRVLESGFAGACLLEWKNDATAAWFTPRHEYWEYESVEEARELAEWLAGHPKIAGATAAALQARVEKEHAPAVFWRRVFEAIGK
jgi:hypothetical protein